MSQSEKLYCVRCGIRIDRDQATLKGQKTGDYLCGPCMDDLINGDTRPDFNQTSETQLKGLHEQTPTR